MKELIPTLFGSLGVDEPNFKFGDYFIPFNNLRKEIADLEEKINVDGFIDLGETYEHKMKLHSPDSKIDVEVENNVIKISDEVKTENSSYYSSRSFTLPKDADISTINAEINDEKTNELVITIKKKFSKPIPKNKKIDVKIK